MANRENNTTLDKPDAMAASGLQLEQPQTLLTGGDSRADKREREVCSKIVCEKIVSAYDG